MIILLLGHVPYSLGQLHSEIMSTLNRTKVVFYIALTTVIVNIILNYYLIPILGMIGGAISTSISLLLMYLIYAIITYKLIRIQILSFDYIKAIISGIISIYLIYLITLLFNVNTIFTLIVFSLLFLFIYIMFLFLLKAFEEEDKEVIHTIIKKFKY